MIVKQRENREQVEIFSIEEFVPADHQTHSDIQENV